MNSSKSKAVASQRKQKKQKSKSKGKEAMSSGKGAVNSAPLARSRAMRTAAPSVSGSPYSGDGRVRIRHREFVADVAGSTAFAVSRYPINPGLSNSFPWLSEIAQRFESYLFRSLSFEYETQRSASTDGSIMMAVDFDAADSAPVNKLEIMAFHNAVRSAVWEECCYKSDGPDLQKFGVQRYIRKGGIGPNLDIKTYDVGNLYVASQGEVDTSAIGELYVVYDVELITPQLSGNEQEAGRIITSSTTLNMPFLPPNTQTGSSAIHTNDVNSLDFDHPGCYMLTCDFQGTVITGTLPALAGDATLVSSSGNVLANGGATAGRFWVDINVTQPGQSLTFDFTGACTTLVSLDAQISVYDASL